MPAVWIQIIQVQAPACNKNRKYPCQPAGSRPILAIRVLKNIIKQVPARQDINAGLIKRLSIDSIT